MEDQRKSILEATSDPLLRRAELPYVRCYFPYGIPLRVRTNSPLILEAAQQSWGKFEQTIDAVPLEIHVGIHGSAEAPSAPHPVFRTQRHLFTMTGDAQNFGVCDFAAGFAFCWLTPAALRDLPALRYFYLDALGYSLVGERYLTGIHGACVAWNGNGVLLCGESEAGKSTLAYACARSGFTYVSDDGSFLIRGGGGPTVVGNPYSMRFRPSAAALFPELRHHEVSLRANGKLAIEVSTDQLGLVSIAPQMEISCVLFLNRRPIQTPTLVPFSEEAALQLMQAPFHFGRDSTMIEHEASLRRLLRIKRFEFIYSDLESAVDALRQLLETEKP